MLLALALATAMATSDKAPSGPDCHIDHAAMMALSVDAFDQDMDGGWRALDMRTGCQEPAADLIADYRRLPKAQGIGLLAWHEAQIRADLGQSDRAIALMQQSYKTEAEDKAGWNPYVDGTIAFLRKDPAALEQARARLAAVAPPPGMAVKDGYYTMTVDGEQLRVPWPLNLNVLDALLRCFDKDYKTAYGTPACRSPDAGGWEG